MPKRERGFEEKTSSGHAGQGPIAMPKRERVTRQVYQWGPTQNSPGGTPFQTGVVGNQKLIRKAKTTPGGKTKVLHQFCAEGCTDPCTEDKVCRSCHRKNSEANRNARRRKPSDKNIFGDRDETERKGANGCTKKAQQAHNARYYAQNKDKINDSRRKEYKGVFTKSDFAEVEGRKVNLKY